MDVILIRHTSVNVPKGTCYGWSDVPVADTFEQEAAITKKNIEHLEFDMVFSSPLTRARKLAEYCGWANPVVDDRLKEMNMGSWEMKLFDEIEDENLQRWYDDYMHQPTTNGESFPMMYARVAGFLDELKQNLTDALPFLPTAECLCAQEFMASYSVKKTVLNILRHTEELKKLPSEIFCINNRLRHL